MNHFNTDVWSTYWLRSNDKGHWPVTSPPTHHTGVHHKKTAQWNFYKSENTVLLLGKFVSELIDISESYITKTRPYSLGFYSLAWPLQPISTMSTWKGDFSQLRISLGCYLKTFIWAWQCVFCCKKLLFLTIDSLSGACFVPWPMVTDNAFVRNILGKALKIPSFLVDTLWFFSSP
jgi:hypothetical protein